MKNILKLIKKYNLLILFLIVFLAGFLRFYQLGTNPPSLTWDEVAWGYNGYSLGIDGKDEFGRFLPHDYLESFGDFKPPVYAYLTVLPVKIFGLNEFATRFPSAFLGTLTVFLTYFLVKNIFGESKSIDPEYIALLSAFLLAISPWNIMLSHAAFEANVGTFFLVLGVWLFLKAMRDKSSLLILSTITFVLCLYIFNTTRIVAPFLFIGLSIGFAKKLLKMKKTVIVAAIVGIIMLLPTAKFLFTPQARLRFQEVNIFSDSDVVKTTNQEIVNDKNIWYAKILHNRRLVYGVNFSKHYFDNLSFNFLFINGDSNSKFSTQTTGQMYLWELPFLISGIIFLIRKRPEYWWIIPFWLVLGIIPAATARETPHALRIEATLPTFQIITAFGIITALQFVNQNKAFIGKYSWLKYIFLTFFILLAGFNFSYFFEEYFVHYPKEFSGAWQYGYKDAISYVTSVENKYDNIYFTQNLGRPYIYVLFYTKTNPAIYRKDANIQRDPFGFVHVNSFDKYYFDLKLLASSTQKKNTLYIETPDSVPGGAHIQKKFYLVDGTISLEAYTL